MTLLHVGTLQAWLAAELVTAKKDSHQSGFVVRKTADMRVEKLVAAMEMVTEYLSRPDASGEDNKMDFDIQLAPAMLKRVA